jgi:hypothetical protein
MKTRDVRSERSSQRQRSRELLDARRSAVSLPAYQRRSTIKQFEATSAWPSVLAGSGDTRL